ncbi:MAG: rhodanese-like domain-containing protein, partial [Micropepsaceae bacterium]
HNAPSKALGLFAAKELSIPEIEPDQLAALLEKNADIKIVDCRPFAEYQRGSVPGALNAPGVELLRLMAGGSLDSHLIVTCAGRTRGLLGTQTLIDAGVTGRITALHKGTMGWELSGRALEKKAGRKLDSHLAGDIAPADIARSMRLRGEILVLDENALTRWLKDKDRTTYLFDIRTREEFEAGHFPDARHVVGGQLVQKFDQHVATQGARIVVSDDDGLRASSTALWLRRMGWSDVAIAPIAGRSVLEEGGARSLSAPLPKDTRYIVADAPDEIVLKPSELTEGREQAMRDYFSGLDDLLEKIERDGSLRLIALPMH